jgi:hypothetical protein
VYSCTCVCVYGCSSMYLDIFVSVREPYWCVGVALRLVVLVLLRASSALTVTSSLE